MDTEWRRAACTVGYNWTLVELKCLTELNEELVNGYNWTLVELKYMSINYSIPESRL